jgi:hypothetical protein
MLNEKGLDVEIVSFRSIHQWTLVGGQNPLILDGPFFSKFFIIEEGTMPTNLLDY